MTLQDIVAFCNQLAKINVQTDSQNTVRALEAIVYTVTNSKVQSQDLAQQLDRQFQDIRQDLHNFDKIIATIHSNLVTVLAANDQRCIDQDCERYKIELDIETVDMIQNRAVTQTTAGLEKLTARIKLLADWRMPGMIFRPTAEAWMQDLVTLDPLYIVDHDQALLQPFMAQFNELYQRRLRPYVLDKHIDAGVLSQLPDDQYGLILAYNFLNYKPLPLMKIYLSEILKKLRPGGTLLFTFNDCDIAQNMGLWERMFMMYQPWRLLKPYLDELAVEIVSVNHDGGDMVWAEVRRLGQLVSLRGAQTLAKIVAM